MRRTLLALLAALLTATPLAAQQVWESARVLPLGVFSLRAAGVQIYATQRFTAEGRGPLPHPALPTSADLLVGAPALRADLASLFEELELSHGQPPPPAAADPALLTTGEFGARTIHDRRTAPIELSVGVLPRVQLTARVPLVREMSHPHEGRFAGGTLGTNPAPAQNRQVLEAFGFGDLGGGAVLPLAGSPAGEALAARVAAAGGGELQLPQHPFTFTAYRALLAQSGGELDFEHVDSDWRGAAIEGGARVLLLARDAAPADAPARFGYRLAAEASVLRQLVAAPEPYLETAVGAGMRQTNGAAGALLLDLLFAGRGELHAVVRSGTREEGRWSEATLAPRARFAGALSLGGVYSFVRGGSGDPSDGGGSLHLVGGGLAYSTLGAARENRRILPVEAALLYRAAVAGEAGSPVVRSLSVEGRIFYDLLRR
jgi:hypothetical protein